MSAAAELGTCADCVVDGVPPARAAVGRYVFGDDTPPRPLCREHVDERAGGGQWIEGVDEEEAAFLEAIPLSREERSEWRRLGPLSLSNLGARRAPAKDPPVGRRAQRAAAREPQPEAGPQLGLFGDRKVRS